MGRWAILNGVLVLIVILLGLQIARTWSRTLPPVETVARGTDPGAKDQDKPDGKTGGGRRAGGKRGPNDKAEPQPTVLVTTIVNKDLFDPSRQKPSEEVKPPAPKEVGPPPNLTLVGVRMIGRDREILVTDAGQGNQQRRLRIGDQLGGYTLKTIQPSRVTLAAASGDVVTLTLAVDKTPGGAPAGVPPKPGAVPPRPGQPAGAPAGSPAAGVTSPAAGVQPRVPRPPGNRPPGRPAGPGAVPTPPAAPGTPTAAGIQQAPVPAAPAPAAPAPPTAGIIPPTTAPNLPAAVREKLEHLKGN